MAVTAPAGSRLKTTAGVPVPSAERSMRKASGSAPSGWRRSPLRTAGIGVCPRIMRVAAPDDDLDAGPERHPRLGVGEHAGTERVEAAEVAPGLRTVRDVCARGVSWEVEEMTDQRVRDGRRCAAGVEPAGVGEREDADPVVGSEHHVRAEALPYPVVTHGPVSADLVAKEPQPHAR
jgi:hypothetical protein